MISNSKQCYVELCKILQTCSILKKVKKASELKMIIAMFSNASFNAENAVQKLTEKFEKAELRTKMDSGAALPLKLPPHLQNVTN